MSDIFPPRRLALPMSVMGAGAPLGGALALIIGSFILGLVPNGISLPLIGRLEGWQFAFVAVGFPGLLLAPLIWTVKRPGRRGETGGPQDIQTHSIIEVLRYLFSQRRFYAGHFLGFGLYSMIGYAMTAWLPTFLIRRHGWELAEAGYAIGALVFIVSMPGSLLMGWLVDRWYASGRRNAHLLFFAGCAIVQMVSVVAAMLVSDPRLALIFLVPQMATAGFTGVAAAALQITTPSRMRGQTSAIYLLVFNLLGIGLGPSVVAAFTDFFFHDELRVGSSLILTYIIFAPLAATLMLYAAPAMTRRVGEVDSATRMEQQRGSSENE